LLVSPLFFALESPGTTSIAAFQAKIHNGENLAQLARCSVAPLPAETQFGFSAAAPSVSFFRVGHWYAESLAYAAGGKTDTARQRLVAIATQLGSVPAGLNTLTQGKPSHAHIAALEPELARLAPKPRDAVLFRTGGQLVNLLLAVAAHDRAMLRGAAPEILRLRQNSNHSAWRRGQCAIWAHSPICWPAATWPSATTTRPPG